jgi:hypothetical protein
VVKKGEEWGKTEQLAKREKGKEGSNCKEGEENQKAPFFESRAGIVFAMSRKSRSQLRPVA